VARSARYRLLIPRLAELRQHLLPAEFDPTQAYSDRQLDRVFGYRLLAHAEFESCIEDLVRETVTTAWKGWVADGRPRTCLMALVAYYEGDLGRPPETFTPQQKSKKMLIHLAERVDKARNHHINQVVRNNHGITESDLLALLLPVGVLESDINKTWLATINSFGSQRGDTAHQTGRAQQKPDPQNELRTVREIATGLEQLDRRLTALHSA
jgi:hypothetical protein